MSQMTNRKSRSPIECQGEPGASDSRQCHDKMRCAQGLVKAAFARYLPHQRQIENLGFEWKPSISRRKGHKSSQSSTRACRVLTRALRNHSRVYATVQPQEDSRVREIRSNEVDVASAPESESSMALRAGPEFGPFEVERREVQSDNFNPEQSHVLSPWRRSCQPHSFSTQIESITAMRVCKMVVVAPEHRGVCVILWEERLSELADYCKLHGHCNVPHRYKENAKLATWVATQRRQYKLHFEGKASHITPFRIQALESLGFELVICDTA
jgi:hypothetical protein